MADYKYKIVLIAGLWDYLHQGHKTFLDKAFGIAEKVKIIIMEDSIWHNERDYVADRKQDFQTRLDGLKKYLDEKSYIGREEIITAKNEDDVIKVASGLEFDIGMLSEKDKVECTNKVVQSVAKLRKDEGKGDLEVNYIPTEIDKDGNAYSSSKIRKLIAKEKEISQ